MRVGVGYSENPDSVSAGIEAAKAALAQAQQSRPCDMILLFCTSQHDQALLRDAVASILGKKARIIGGGAVGTITNDHYGYAGDQVGLAAFWLNGIQCDVLADSRLREGEFASGQRLGKKLADMGAMPDSPVMLFYDAIDRTMGNVDMLMATPLLAGMKDGLGFLPNLLGAGLQGDYICTPTRQWLNGELVEHHALALAYKGDLRIDSAVMHGCRPATGYYTVTKAEKQTILEINHQPALQFVHSIIGPTLPVEEYAFFLIFGINRGEKWAPFNESLYANRLCLAIDKKRDGIVMFEPDMVEGTVFQIMHRSLDLEYMTPKIEELFARIGNRKPVFGFYIDCAGRAAGYAGTNLEDALVLQKAVGSRMPLLGIYSGVEIAPVMGESRALDWTGVFCLYSVPE